MTSPTDLPRRTASTFALVIAGGLAGVALGLPGVSSAATLTPTPTPAPTPSATAPAATDQVPADGDVRDCPEHDGTGAASPSPDASGTTTPSQAPTGTPSV